MFITRLVLVLITLLIIDDNHLRSTDAGIGINLGNVINQWNKSPVQKQTDTNSETSLNVFCYLYHTALYSSLFDDSTGFQWKSEEIWSTCSHIIYAFAEIDSESNRLRSAEAQLDLGLNDHQQRGGRHDMMRKMNEYKRKYNNNNNNNNNKKQSRPVKILLSIGGAGSKEADKLNKIASNAKARRQFANNVVQYLITYGFDGLDLDWEYPDNEQSLINLLKELHELFCKKSLLLTLTLPPGVWTARGTYNLPIISKYLDYMNIMAYDYYGPWSDKAGSNAPLKASSIEEANLNVDQIVQYYKSKLTGSTESWRKLGMGIPFYARGFLLAPQIINIGQKNIKEKIPRKIDAKASSNYNLAFDYEFVCKQIAGKKLIKFHRDPNEITPSAIVEHGASRKQMFLSWEDPISIRAKVEYAKEQGLGSLMIWKLDTDDYSNTGPSQCRPPDYSAHKQTLSDDKDGPFPLLKAIKKANRF